ncbi:hypothetical protein, partial [Oleiphilus sp. HI0132]
MRDIRQGNDQTIFATHADLNRHKFKPALRHCAQCSALFYHSDIYDYPWLTNCPIHDTTLGSTCSRCHSPYPKTRQEIATRHCPQCGRGRDDRIEKTLASIIEGQASLAEKIDSTVGYLTNLITNIDEKLRMKLGDEDRLIQKLGLSFPYPSRFSPEHPDFWAICCKAGWCKKKQLRAIHGVEVSKISSVTFYLQSYDTEAHRDRYFEQIHDLETLVLEYGMSRLKLISGLLKQHRLLSIQSYRYLSINHFQALSPPCPICFALSVWLMLMFTLTSHFHSAKVLEKSLEEMTPLFLKQTGWAGCYTLIQRLVKAFTIVPLFESHALRHFIVPRAFDALLYALLRYAIHFQQTLNTKDFEYSQTYRLKHGDEYETEDLVSIASFSGSADELSFCLSKEDVLNKIKALDWPAIEACKCGLFQQEYRSLAPPMLTVFNDVLDLDTCREDSIITYLHKFRSHI